MFELGRILQLMGLVVVPMALLRPVQMEEFGLLMIGAGLFLVGRHLANRND
ncbi:MAG: hypothetical protein VYB34_10065 [Planctomycetota bacterium]|nr:hypothetical protein [Planctomycetota bacterium]|tara:strand:+ start:355 stop:507 length:153 start_codon:yes stop_codon:yes gene_type:complete